MTALQQTCSAFITVHDRTRPLEHKRGDYTSATVVFPTERVFLALPEHIEALSTQNYRLPDGSGSPGRAWMVFAELLTYLFPLIQLSLSQKEPLGFTVPTAPGVCFSTQPTSYSTEDQEGTRLIRIKLCHITLKIGNFSLLEDAIRAHQGSAHNAVPDITVPLFSSSHRISFLPTQITPFQRCGCKKQNSIINDG